MNAKKILFAVTGIVLVTAAYTQVDKYDRRDRMDPDNRKKSRGAGVLNSSKKMEMEDLAPAYSERARSFDKLDHHLSVSHELYNDHVKTAGHIHAAGGAIGLGISALDISAKMRKDFYILSAGSFIAAGGYYFSTLNDYQKLANPVDKKHHYAQLVDRARQTRLITASTQLALGAGFLAFYSKHHNDPSKDAHSASLVSLIVGAAKVGSGIFHLMNKSQVEKHAHHAMKAGRFASKFDISVHKDSPMLVFNSTF